MTGVFGASEETENGCRIWATKDPAFELGGTGQG
jgi:hypothetical protein